MVKSYSEYTIDQLSRGILDDEFDDGQQNVGIYDGRISGYDTLSRLVTEYSAETSVLIVGAGSSFEGGYHAATCYYLEPNEKRAGDSQLRIAGWCENIETDKLFDVIVCWGTLCFVRSLQESLVQFNYRLQLGGRLIVDVVKSTVLPIAQTTDPDSFVRYVDVFGFALESRIPFGHDTHQREGFRFKKVREFSPSYLRMPQCTGRIKNFLFDRDWYLT